MGWRRARYQSYKVPSVQAVHAFFVRTCVLLRGTCAVQRRDGYGTILGAEFLRCGRFSSSLEVMGMLAVHK
jgi:hypothetical protein